MNLKLLMVLIILLYTAVLSDYIALNNGMGAKTDILDTVGCKIQIRRNGNIVQIAKDDILFIVCNAETLFYKNFVCTPEIASKKTGKVFEDSYNSEKVKTIIEKMNIKNGKIRECIVCYCKKPIIGDDFECCWDEKFALFEKELQAKYKNIRAISHEELYKMLKNGSDTNTIILPFSVKFSYSNSKSTNIEISPKDLFSSGSVAYNDRKNILYTFVQVKLNLIVVDLKDNMILYNEIFSYVKDINDYTNFFDDEKKKLIDAKNTILENVLFNSLNSKRKRIPKMSQ